MFHKICRAPTTIQFFFSKVAEKKNFVTGFFCNFAKVSTFLQLFYTEQMSAAYWGKEIVAKFPKFWFSDIRGDRSLTNSFKFA